MISVHLFLQEEYKTISFLAVLLALASAASSLGAAWLQREAVSRPVSVVTDIWSKATVPGGTGGGVRSSAPSEDMA